MVMPLGNEDQPRIVPWVTYLLIVLNLGCYGLELLNPISFSIAYAVTPYEITHRVDIHNSFTYRVEPTTDPANLTSSPGHTISIHQAAGPRPIWLTLITALFLHADLIHVAGNMLFLFIFGQKIEEAFGRLTYLIFYLLCGVIGTLTQINVAPESLTPILGASGAIAGVMGAYLVWFPRDQVRVLVLNFLVLIPAYGVIGCWILIQIIKGYFSTEIAEQVGHIAYLSHIGGAMTGIVASVLIWFGKPFWTSARAGDRSANSDLRGAMPDHDSITTD